GGAQARLGIAELSACARRQFSPLDPDEADLVDGRLLVAVDEVLLELEPALVGADLGPDRLVAHRLDRRRDAERPGEFEHDLAEERARSEPRRPDDVGRQVAIAQPEPRLFAVALGAAGRG